MAVSCGISACQACWSDTCYLINHPDGRLLWDLGLPGMLVGAGEQTVGGIFKVSMGKTITQQLADLGLTPADIKYLSLSHDHFDHIGQIDQVQGVTWIVQEDEYNDMFPPEGAATQAADPQLAAMWAAFRPLEPLKIKGDHDVFGDGTVKILEMPATRRDIPCCCWTCRKAGPSCWPETSITARKAAPCAVCRGLTGANRRRWPPWTSSKHWPASLARR